MKIIKIILLIATFSLLNTNAFGEESKKKDCSKYSAGDIINRVKMLGCKADNWKQGKGTLVEWWNSSKKKN